MKKALFQLHIAVFLAGFTAILGKLIQLNEGWLVWYRLLVTVIALGFFLLIRKEFKRISLKDFFQIAWVGSIIAFHWVTFYGSIKYANASIALVCLSASGFITAIVEPLVFGRRIIWIELLLGVAGITGIYIIFDFHPNFKVGILFGLISAFASALFPIFNKKLLLKFEPRTLTLYELTGGWVALSLLLPIYLALFPEGNYIPSLSDWGWLLVLGIICTVICFDLQLNALKKISAFTATFSYNLEPVYGIILAFLFFDEGKMFNQSFYWGLALVVIALVIQTLRVYFIHKRVTS